MIIDFPIVEISSLKLLVIIYYNVERGAWHIIALTYFSFLLLRMYTWRSGITSPHNKGTTTCSGKSAKKRVEEWIVGIDS